MWELIRANKRNSIILMVLMAATLLLLGYIIGSAYAGQQAGFIGLIFKPQKYTQTRSVINFSKEIFFAGRMKGG